MFNDMPDVISGLPKFSSRNLAEAPDKAAELEMSKKDLKDAIFGDGTVNGLKREGITPKQLSGEVVGELKSKVPVAGGDSVDSIFIRSDRFTDPERGKKFDDAVDLVKSGLEANKEEPIIFDGGLLIGKIKSFDLGDGVHLEIHLDGHTNIKLEVGRLQEMWDKTPKPAAVLR